MKKFILTILILNISLFSLVMPSFASKYHQTGRYVNEIITVPINDIGASSKNLTEENFIEPTSEKQEKYFSATQNEEKIEPPIIQEDDVDKNLAIEWNKWHADVRNVIAQDIYSTLTPSNYIIMCMFTVDKNRKISDIIVTYFPKNSVFFTKNATYIKKDKIFYVYKANTNSYYHAFIPTETKYTIGANYSSENLEMREILNNCKLVKQTAINIPYPQMFKSISTKTQNRQGEDYLEYPKGSKRTSISVAGGITDIRSASAITSYTPNLFNDIEMFNSW